MALSTLASCLRQATRRGWQVGTEGRFAAALVPLAATQQHESSQHSVAALAGTAAIALAGAAAVASAASPCHARCEPAARSSPPSEQRGWLGLPRWLYGWVPGLRDGGKGQEEGAYLQAIREDPHVAVVLSFALPYLHLSFAYAPSPADMEAAACLVLPHLAELRPWEVSVLLWGAARLGYRPAQPLVSQLQERVAAILKAPPGSPQAFTAQEASMAAWALSALQAQTPELWAAEVAFVAACPPEDLDEVALIHLWQAAMFVDRGAVAAPLTPAGPVDAALPRLRSAVDEVRATLAAGGCSLPLINRCEQSYRAASRQAGFDGPYLIELTMLRLLVTIYTELGDSLAYQPFFSDLRLLDLQHARQLLADPYLLAKFKGEIADKRARANAFTRTLDDVSRTLRGLGLHHAVQRPVEDDLVHVDIALPDYRIAFFLETPAASPARGAAAGVAASRGGGAGAAGAGRLTTLDAEGTMLSGYMANETPGTKQAKQRMLEQRGWVVLPLAWPESMRGEAEKRRVLLEQLDRAGRQQLMRGRVSSMLHGAMRTAEESKLGSERYERQSAGANITRGATQQ